MGKRMNGLPVPLDPSGRDERIFGGIEFIEAAEEKLKNP